MLRLIKEILVGIGQIFLQENGLSGLIITIAMFFSQWTLGVACFLGSLIGTLTAKTLKYPAYQIKMGLYGFNASLTFMCVMFTFGEDCAGKLSIWLIAILGCVISTILMRAFTQRNKVAFTFPFVLTCWFLCWGIAKLKLFGLTQTSLPLPELTNAVDAMREPFYAWAEVNFGSSIVTGTLLFLAIAISSPSAAMWGVTAATIGTVFAHHLLGIDQNTLTNGIYGFSPILVACVFAGRQLRNFFYVVIGVIVAVLIQYLFSLIGIASYTIGFIIASWILLAIKAKIENNQFDEGKLVKILNP